MIVSIDWDAQNNTITVVCGNKTIQLVYTNLPPGWEQNPEAYSSFVVDYLNNQIETRTDRKVWLQDKGLTPNTPLPFTDSERLWYDDVADEVVFMDIVVTDAIWSDSRQEYLLQIRNTESFNLRV